MPGHASMVHGELGGDHCEVVSTAGICVSGMTALKYGAMSVASGLTENAAVTGSELASSFLRTDFFGSNPKDESADRKKRHPAFSFEADFLRWMLSDGAGAVFLRDTPRVDGISLRIDWIEIISHAHRLETCMYAGAVKRDNSTIKGWREFTTMEEATA